MSNDWLVLSPGCDGVQAWEASRLKRTFCQGISTGQGLTVTPRYGWSVPILEWTPFRAPKCRVVKREDLTGLKAGMKPVPGHSNS